MRSVQQYLELPGYEPVPIPLADDCRSNVIRIPVVNRYQMFFISESFNDRPVPIDAGQPTFETVDVTRERALLNDPISGRGWWEWRWNTTKAEQDFAACMRVRGKFRAI